MGSVPRECLTESSHSGITLSKISLAGLAKTFTTRRMTEATLVSARLWRVTSEGETWTAPFGLEPMTVARQSRRWN